MPALQSTCLRLVLPPRSWPSRHLHSQEGADANHGEAMTDKPVLIVVDDLMRLPRGLRHATVAAAVQARGGLVVSMGDFHADDLLARLDIAREQNDTARTTLVLDSMSAMADAIKPRRAPREPAPKRYQMVLAIVAVLRGARA